MGKGNKKRGYTKIETDWFGNKYVQRYNESGKKIGYIKKETDLLGKRIAQHYTQDGKKKGYSTKERDLLANPYRQFYSKNHGKTGYSKKTENLLGHKRTEHYSEQYKKRGYSKKEYHQTSWRTFDLLYKGIEITSGAQREHRPSVLESQIAEKGLSLEPFEPYINFFKYGCPPHGGFAPGPTMILMKMLGMDNVREVTYLYRGVNRLTP